MLGRALARADFAIEGLLQPASSGRSTVRMESWASIYRWPTSDCSPAIGLSNFSLLCHFERVVYFNAQISNRAFKSGVSQEQLYGTQILCAPVE